DHQSHSKRETEVVLPGQLEDDDRRAHGPRHPRRKCRRPDQCELPRLSFEARRERGCGRAKKWMPALISLLFMHVDVAATLVDTRRCVRVLWCCSSAEEWAARLHDPLRQRSAIMAEQCSDCKAGALGPLFKSFGKLLDPQNIIIMNDSSKNTCN
ncbi:unnamed protein product, partial [Hapterophycus canaliculatus]